jgi:hypothetical protein
MAYDAARGMVVRYGGNQEADVYNTTFEWESQQWQFRNPATQPPDRMLHAMAFDAAGHESVLFGGDGTGDRQETWVWDGVDWTDRTNSPAPSGRWSHGMAYDTARQRTVLFGGRSFGFMSVDLGDTWEWDGTQWWLAATTGPPAGSGRAIAYDSKRALTILFRGGDTWVWDGLSWQSLAVPGGGPPCEHWMAYDAERDVIVMQCSNETWEFVVAGDFDFDTDIDLTDFALFAQCFGGSMNPPAPGCPFELDADFDNDGDVDLIDFTILAQNFTGSQ